MFISSCPLRVSLFGGSTDNPVFVERYGFGSVISFACSLKTYITLHEDKLGYIMRVENILLIIQKEKK